MNLSKQENEGKIKELRKALEEANEALEEQVRRSGPTQEAARPLGTDEREQFRKAQEKIAEMQKQIIEVETLKVKN